LVNFNFVNSNRSYLFVPEPKQPYVINISSSRIFTIQTKENDKVMANFIYGDFLLVEFKTQLVLLNLKTYHSKTFELKKGMQISFPFFETIMKITY
jgi:hypothetical protein